MSQQLKDIINNLATSAPQSSSPTFSLFSQVLSELCTLAHNEDPRTWQSLLQTISQLAKESKVSHDAKTQESSAATVENHAPEALDSSAALTKSLPSVSFAVAPPPIRAPPPPLGKSVSVRMKKVVRPSIKMKQLNWSKIPTSKVTGTFWEKVDDVDLSSKLDAATLEEEFGAKQAITRTRSFSADTARKLSINIIDPRRSNNFSIALMKYKLDLSRTKEAVLNLDEKVLTPEIATTLLNFCPTDEEVTLLREYHGKRSLLPKAEQFLCELMDVPFLEARLKCLITKQQFSEHYRDSRKRIKLITNASKELMASKRWAKILEMTLAIGNFINAGTQRGDASGFRLSELKSMLEMKGNDAKTSLLHFLVNSIQASFPEVLAFSVELPSVDAAAHYTFESIESVATQLKKTIALMEEKCSLDGIDPMFLATFSKFALRAKPKVERLERRLQGAVEAFRKMLIYFGENPTTTASDEFFSSISKFIEAFEKAHRESLQLLRRSTSSAHRSRTMVRKNSRNKDKEMEKTLLELKTQFQLKHVQDDAQDVHSD